VKRGSGGRDMPHLDSLFTPLIESKTSGMVSLAE
jgi:hypothetical protein